MQQDSDKKNIFKDIFILYKAKDVKTFFNIENTIDCIIMFISHYCVLIEYSLKIIIFVHDYTHIKIVNNTNHNNGETSMSVLCKHLKKNSFAKCQCFHSINELLMHKN